MEYGKVYVYWKLVYINIEFFIVERFLFSLDF